jgi:hypothetical protein
MICNEEMVKYHDRVKLNVHTYIIQNIKLGSQLQEARKRQDTKEVRAMLN